jgi:hypothetical protein
VLEFRRAILKRWPDLNDVIEPPDFALEENPGSDSQFVLLTLAGGKLDYISELISMAKEHGLVGFSGVAGAAF